MMMREILYITISRQPEKKINLLTLPVAFLYLAMAFSITSDTFRSVEVLLLLLLKLLPHGTTTLISSKQIVTFIIVLINFG